LIAAEEIGWIVFCLNKRKTIKVASVGFRYP